MRMWGKLLEMEQGEFRLPRASTLAFSLNYPNRVATYYYTM